MNYFGIGKDEEDKKKEEEPEEEAKEENKEEEKKDEEDEGPQINARDVPPIITGLQRKRPKFAPE